MALNLGSLIDTKRIDEGIWVTYKETQFQVKVSYYGKPQMAAIFERCKTKSVNLRTLKEEERINNPVFREEYADLVIREWKGLTLDVLRKLASLPPHAPTTLATAKAPPTTQLWNQVEAALKGSMARPSR